MIEIITLAIITSLSSFAFGYLIKAHNESGWKRMYLDEQKRRVLAEESRDEVYDYAVRLVTRMIAQNWRDGMNVPKKHRAIAHAWVDGAQVEGRKIRAEGADIDYIHLDKPSWYENWEYRIKPTKPSINWEHVAPKYVALATEKHGSSYLFTGLPEATDEGWEADFTFRSADVFQSFVKGTCDWKDSLVLRPSTEREEKYGWICGTREVRGCPDNPVIKDS